MHEDDVNVPSPAEEVIDPSTPLDPEGGPYDPSSVVSSLDELIMASPKTPVSKRVDRLQREHHAYIRHRAGGRC